MKKNMLVRLVLIITIIGMTGTAFAWNGAGRRGQGMGQYDAWSKLTDDQRGKLDALQQKFIDETATARAAIIAKHEEIRILMETSAPDKVKLHALSNELTELKKQVMDKNIDLALDAKKIAPDFNMPMGFHGFGHHGMMNGCKMMGNCSIMGGRGMGMMNNGCAMMNGNGMGMMGGMNKGMQMKAKGMGKLNCPAVNAPQDNNKAQADENKTDSAK